MFAKVGKLGKIGKIAVPLIFEATPLKRQQPANTTPLGCV
jgi:hypothetical protein